MTRNPAPMAIGIDGAMLDRIEPGAVRPEYAALVDGYPELLRAFGVTLSAIELADLSILMAAIEHVDRVIDAEPDVARRAAMVADILALLASDSLEACATPVARSVRALRQLAIRCGIQRALVALTTDTLANTEQMRMARDREQYLACVEREGVLCVELALLVAPLPAAPTAFLRAIAPAANLLDKLLDLRGDHRRGEVGVDPGPRTHLALAARMLARAWVASRLHPSRLGFTRWGLGWVQRMRG